MFSYEHFLTDIGFISRLTLDKRGARFVWSSLHMTMKVPVEDVSTSVDDLTGQDVLVEL